MDQVKAFNHRLQVSFLLIVYKAELNQLVHIRQHPEKIKNKKEDEQGIAKGSPWP